jgi:hypothetical protein
MRDGTNDGELSKVFVERDDNLRSFESPRKDHLIAGIHRPVGDGFNVVSRVFQDAGSSSPDARVEEHLHETQ